MTTDSQTIAFTDEVCVMCETAPATCTRKGEGWHGSYELFSLCLDCKNKPVIGTCPWCKQAEVEIVRLVGTSEEQYQAFFVCGPCSDQEYTRRKTEEVDLYGD